MLVTCTSAKGGVGKTTSAIHLAALLAQSDRTIAVPVQPLSFPELLRRVNR